MVETTPFAPVTILRVPVPDPVGTTAGGVVLVRMVVTEPFSRVEVKVTADGVGVKFADPLPEAPPEVIVAEPDEELVDLTTGQVKSKRGVVLRVVPTTPNCGCFSVSVLASTRVYQ